MPLVVLTYPGHFLLTALTIRSYLEYHTPTEVIVVADDLSTHAWSTYLKDCQDMYWAPVIPVSQLAEAHHFNIGWIRQQIVKLYLDQLISCHSWFFTDGDIVFLHPVDPADIPYSVPDFNNQDILQNQYVRELLKIDYPGILVDQKRVCVSDPAFRTMSKQTLIELREYIKLQHNQDLYKLHIKYQTQDLVAVSEWELIENFKQKILNEQLALIKYAPHNLDNAEANLNFFTHQFLTCYSTDYGFGRDWFKDREIVVSDEIWQILSNINR